MAVKLIERIEITALKAGIGDFEVRGQVNSLYVSFPDSTYMVLLLL